MMRQNGFTLVELMVATAILALLAIVGFESLRFATRSWSAVVLRGGEMDEIWTAQRFLRGRLEQLYPFSPAVGTPDRAYAVMGTANEISFSAPLPSGADDDGFYRFRIFSRVVGKETELWVAWRLERKSGDWQEEKLLTRAGRMQWDYLEMQDRQPPRWVNDWTSRPDVPALVRLKMKFDAQDRRQWPELVVRPRVNAAANCVFDFVRRRCHYAG